MRFAVEAWSAEYGAPMEGGGLPPAPDASQTDLERPLGEWAPLDPPPGLRPAHTVVFVDGVRRIDARLWITTEDGLASQAICASFAAGAVRSTPDGAELVTAEVGRGVFGPAVTADVVTPQGTWARAAAEEDTDRQVQAVQQRMGELEGRVAAAAGDADLVVTDGNLPQGTTRRNLVGHIKTHRVGRLPDEGNRVVAALAPGQRSPLFLIQEGFGTPGLERYSWYLRLPGGGGHAWAGIVRCEASRDLPLADAIALADQAAVTLVRYASTPQRDPRAPQNLAPIGRLEQELRRHLGDQRLLLRALQAAAGTPA